MIIVNCDAKEEPLQETRERNVQSNFVGKGLAI